MKYVALLSGGKDSCYNLVHCAKNGHELIAAASLGPAAGREELDSYLYQTVGQDAIEFVARALEVPLFRRVITGDAVEQGSEYGGRSGADVGGVVGDETEDLLALLCTVKSHHPDVQGVSVGAILSNYQRVRVEHVCRRLGLTPLCYLWQRHQGELLDEMIGAGMEAILIKVAGIGLTTKHLGKTLGDMQPTFKKLNDLYGSHICGEGGEYESLTLDCPLFKHRIVLTEVETVIHSDSSFATVAYLRIKNAVLEPKEPSNVFDVQVPPLLDDSFVALHDAVIQSQHGKTLFLANELTTPAEVFDQTRSKRLDSWVAVANIESNLGDSAAELSIEDEVQECFSILAKWLAENNLDVSNCVNINIFLSSMDLFTRVNAVYSTFFGSSPPARACVAIDLPHPRRVRLDCIAYVENNQTNRQALHVQGLSYWAPANIGPYSQAITAGERVFISGQIGLIPSRLALPGPPSLPLETGLASQHVARITDALRANSGGGWVGHAQTVLYWFTSITHMGHVKDACRGVIDSERIECPTLFLVVKALPKEALVEKQVLLHTGRCAIKDEDDGDISIEAREPSHRKHHVDFSTESSLHWEVSRLDEALSACAIICVRGGQDGLIFKDVLKASKDLSSFSRGSLSIRLFYIPSRTASLTSVFNAIFGSQIPPITPIPCRFLSTKDSDNWDYVIHIIGT